MIWRYEVPVGGMCHGTMGTTGRARMTKETAEQRITGITKRQHHSVLQKDRKLRRAIISNILKGYDRETKKNV